MGVAHKYLQRAEDANQKEELVMKKPVFSCLHCGAAEERATVIEECEQSFAVRGENISVTAAARVCSRCDQVVEEGELHDAAAAQAVDTYRRRHRLLSPQDIRELRNQYGLSQRALAALLGLGEITIHRYESGNLPDDAPNQLLRFIRDPRNMVKLLEENGDRLSAATRRRLTLSLAQIQNRSSQPAGARREETAATVNGDDSSSILTGNCSFSSTTMKEMMLFFASRRGGVLKTKLNKLLWYADFHHFRLHRMSISGATYIHYPYGPVARGYEMFLARLIEEGSLRIEEEYFENCPYAGERLLAAVVDSTLSASALKVMAETHKSFQAYGSRAISEMSHEEVAYTETSSGQQIPYSYASQLKFPLTLAKVPPRHP